LQRWSENPPPIKSKTLGREVDSLYSAGLSILKLLIVLFTRISLLL